MINGKRVIVVMPASNAAKTLKATVRELPDAVDECILVDDQSSDATVTFAHRLGLTVEVPEVNRGYGGNQKICYACALAAGSPRLVMALASMVACGEISCPTRCFPEASSINFRRSCVYGFGVVKTSLGCRLAKWGWFGSSIFQFPARILERAAEPISLAARR